MAGDFRGDCAVSCGAAGADGCDQFWTFGFGDVDDYCLQLWTGYSACCHRNSRGEDIRKNSGSHRRPESDTHAASRHVVGVDHGTGMHDGFYDLTSIQHYRIAELMTWS